MSVVSQMGAALATAPVSMEREMGRGGGGEEKAPSNQGSSNPNVRISVEERRAPVVPGTENKVPGTIHSEAPLAR